MRLAVTSLLGPVCRIYELSVAVMHLHRGPIAICVSCVLRLLWHGVVCIFNSFGNCRQQLNGFSEPRPVRDLGFAGRQIGGLPSVTLHWAVIDNSYRYARVNARLNCTIDAIKRLRYATTSAHGL